MGMFLTQSFVIAAKARVRSGMNICVLGVNSDSIFSESELFEIAAGICAVSQCFFNFFISKLIFFSSTLTQI